MVGNCPCPKYCSECARHPVEIDAHYHGSSIRLVGCEKHTAQLSQLLSDVQTLAHLEFDSGEIDGILDKFNWLCVLPRHMRVPFQRLATEIGKLVGIYEALRTAVGQPSRTVDQEADATGRPN